MQIELVRRLMARGVRRIPDIIAALKQMDPPVDITERTLWRYKGILKKRMVWAVRHKEGLNQTVEEIALQIKENVEEVLRELWTVYHSTDNAVAKIMALQQIRKASDEWVKTLQTMGLVYKAPEQHQLLDAQGNPTNPPDVNVAVLNQDFTAFIKAKYQNPVGVKEKNDLASPASQSAQG